VWKLIKRPDETVVQAAQRVSGELAEAVKRMEAVPWKELQKACLLDDDANDYETIRARLISAAKGEQQ
jgi:hypothetical protein